MAPAPIEDETYFLIAKHAQAHALFMRSIRADDIDGTVSEEESDAERQALLALASHTPHNAAELRRKAAYLHVALNGAMDDPELLGSFLQSLLKFRDCHHA